MGRFVPALALLVTAVASNAEAQPERLEPGLGDEPDAEGALAAGEDRDEVGHIRWVERDDPAGDAGTALLTVGGALGSLGAVTLLGIGVDLAIVVACFWRNPCVPPPPSELTFAALGALGGGLLLVVVGAIVDALAPPPRETRRPVTLLDPVVRF